jgi:hypothetical protein
MLTAAQVAADSGEGFVTIVILGALFVGGVLLAWRVLFGRDQ